MRAFRWISEIVFYAIAALVVAALAHGMIVLVIPMVAEHDAYATLSALAPVGATEALPRPAPTRGAFPTSTPASPPPSAVTT